MEHALAYLIAALRLAALRASSVAVALCLGALCFGGLWAGPLLEGAPPAGVNGTENRAQSQGQFAGQKTGQIAGQIGALRVQNLLRIAPPSVSAPQTAIKTEDLAAPQTGLPPQVGMQRFAPPDPEPPDPAPSNLAPSNPASTRGVPLTELERSFAACTGYASARRDAETADHAQHDYRAMLALYAAVETKATAAKMMAHRIEAKVAAAALYAQARFGTRAKSQAAARAQALWQGCAPLLAPLGAQPPPHSGGALGRDAPAQGRPIATHPPSGPASAY